jgi:predicted permease
MILAMSGLQNAFYLPAPLVIALLPPERRDEGMMYVGAAVIILNFLQWTLGPILLSSRGHDGRSPLFSSGVRGFLRSGLPPPVIGTLAGCVGSQIPGLQSAALGTAPGWAWFIELPLRALNLLTPSVGPLAMILLGGVLATGSLSSTLRKRPAILVVLIRLILVPALILWVARRWIPGTGVFFLVLAIEASAPPATNLTIIALRYGNQARQVSSVLLVSYIVGLVTIPLWIGWMGLGGGP